MKNMMTSDKLPIPTSAVGPVKRGRGGRKAKGADGRSPSESTPGSTVVATPTSERGRGKGGRGRGRGRGGRGGKRKRGSDDEVSEVSFA